MMSWGSWDIGLSRLQRNHASLNLMLFIAVSATAFLQAAAWPCTTNSDCDYPGCSGYCCYPWCCGYCGSYLYGPCPDPPLCSPGSWSPNGYVKPASCMMCPAGTYSNSTGAKTSSTCSQCPSGTYSNSTGATTSSTCSQCSAFKCDPGFYFNRSSCTGSTFTPGCSQCAAGSYSSDGSTCSVCQIGCVAGKTYESTPCSPTTDRICTACSSECVSGSTYETRACTPVSDRICTACSSECVSGSTYETRACTPVSDRVCSACSPQCEAGITFESRACSGGLDRLCSLVSPKVGPSSFPHQADAAVKMDISLPEFTPKQDAFQSAVQSMSPNSIGFEYTRITEVSSRRKQTKAVEIAFRLGFSTADQTEAAAEGLTESRLNRALSSTGLPAVTIISPAKASSKPEAASSSDGPNIIGPAVGGAVGGLVALIAIIGGVLYFQRQRRSAGNNDPGKHSSSGVKNLDNLAEDGQAIPPVYIPPVYIPPASAQPTPPAAGRPVPMEPLSAVQAASSYSV